MNVGLFPSAWAKLRRARNHLAELHELEQAYDSADRVQLRMEDTGTAMAVRVQITEPVPGELPLAVGDCVHNLRSALDHVV